MHYDVLIEKLEKFTIEKGSFYSIAIDGLNRPRYVHVPRYVHAFWPYMSMHACMHVVRAWYVSINNWHVLHVLRVLMSAPIFHMV